MVFNAFSFKRLYSSSLLASLGSDLHETGIIMQRLLDPDPITFFFTGAGYEYNVHRYGTEKRGLIRIQRRKASDLARYADRSESGYRTQLLRE